MGGILSRFAIKSSFVNAKAGAISSVQSGEPSGFRGTETPADSSQEAARAIINCFVVSTLSTPLAFLVGANSSLRRVWRIIELEARGSASKTKLSSFTPFGLVGEMVLPVSSI